MTHNRSNHQDHLTADYIDLTTDQIFSLHWQMTNCERFALQDLLRRIQPAISIEVGTYHGGSLQVISHFSKNVISIDIDSTVKDRLMGRFSNVEFYVGTLSDLLPEVLSQCRQDGGDIEFILIDGDHSTDGIRSDINSLLSLKPRKRCIVLMHDSFNPNCRLGIKTADWSSSPYTEMVELDFIPGIYHEMGFDTAQPRSMWGGFACAVLSHEPRREPLIIQASQQGLFDAVRKVSRHHKSILNWRTYLKKLIGYFGVHR